MGGGDSAAAVVLTALMTWFFYSGVSSRVICSLKCWWPHLTAKDTAILRPLSCNAVPRTLAYLSFLCSFFLTSFALPLHFLLSCRHGWCRLLRKRYSNKQRWGKFTDRSHVPVRLRVRLPRSRSRRTPRSSQGVEPRSACSTTAVMSMLSRVWEVRELDPTPMLTR